VKHFKSPFIHAIFASILALSVALHAGAAPATTLAPVPPTVDSITPTELRMHLEFLASDELGGRFTLAPNFGISARYLASRLKAYGFKALGDHGDYLQHFDVISSKADTAKTALTITMGGQTANYSFGDIYPSAASIDGQAEGQMVFVGRGISSPSQKHDDYAGLDVKNKIVLIVPGNTPGVDSSKLADNESGQGAARAHGAVAIIQVAPKRYSAFMQQKGFKERAAERESVRLAKDIDGGLPAATLSPDAADKLLGSFGLTTKAAYDDKKPLETKALDASAKLVVSLHQDRVTTQNVVGLLEGTDPELKKEYVTFSAHYDHLKTGPGGEIYHGADDDGSGTSAILSIAHAMSLQRPKRSVMIIFHAGEELGLLGSEYNADYAPALPLDRMVADLNIDMIGRSKPPGDAAEEDKHLTDAHTIYLVGADRISPELNKLSEQTNSEFQKLNLDYYYNDPNEPERIYFRSDHWNYAKHGIPIIFYFDGVHVDYHKPTDTVDKIDFNKMTAVTKLVFETGWRIANLDHRLKRKSE
jgi:Zn-dependent M28 family amino/carboxypeptidase